VALLHDGGGGGGAAATPSGGGGVAAAAAAAGSGVPVDVGDMDLAAIPGIAAVSAIELERLVGTRTQELGCKDELQSKLGCLGVGGVVAEGGLLLYACGGVGV